MSDSSQVDLLQIKIEQAKLALPAETRQAIGAVDWRTTILDMRAEKGFTYEQLGALELETELLLCGLMNPKDYPKELEKRMGITKFHAEELINDMNRLVFQRIREELIKNTEQAKMTSSKRESLIRPVMIDTASEKTSLDINDTHILKSAGIEILDQNQKELPKPQAHPLIMQKLSGPILSGKKKTEYTLSNISKSMGSVPMPPAPAIPVPAKPSYSLNGDPYRTPPEA